MTKNELIKALQELPGDPEIFISTDEPEGGEEFFRTGSQLVLRPIPGSSAGGAVLYSRDGIPTIEEDEAPFIPFVSELGCGA